MNESEARKEDVSTMINARTTMRFRTEMTVLATLKVVLLLAIKSLWFDQPEARRMRVPDSRVEQHFFGSGLGAQAQRRIGMNWWKGHRDEWYVALQTVLLSVYWSSRRRTGQARWNGHRDGWHSGLLPARQC